MLGDSTQKIIHEENSLRASRDGLHTKLMANLERALLLSDEAVTVLRPESSLDLRPKEAGYFVIKVYKKTRQAKKKGPHFGLLKYALSF